MLYFAYGSNLNPPQMRRRCPGAQPEGRALLTNWRLILTTRGSANIVRAPGAGVYMGRCGGSNRGIWRSWTAGKASAAAFIGAIGVACDVRMAKSDRP